MFVSVGVNHVDSEADDEAFHVRLVQPQTMNVLVLAHSCCFGIEKQFSETSKIYFDKLQF